jgi:signal peptidase II
MFNYLFVICLTITIDQLTKAWVIASLQLFQSIEIIPGLFNLVHVVNSGAAFSILATSASPWRHIFFVSIGVIALIGLSVAFWKLKQTNKYYCLALALIAGGAAGNLIDRIRLGVVIDFLDFYMGKHHWPAFNVADSAICIGAGIFFLINIRQSRKDQTEES